MDDDDCEVLIVRMKDTQIAVYSNAGIAGAVLMAELGKQYMISSIAGS